MNGYMDQKVSGDMRVSVRLKYEITDNQLTLIEERPTHKPKEWKQMEIA
jgi:hypothetical protein